MTTCELCGLAIPETAAEGVCPACAFRLMVDGLPGEPDLEELEDRQPIRYFGDYELLRVVGRGGMGVVYEARQVSLNRNVAVKLLTGGSERNGFAARFKREAEAAAALDHPSIVPIYEFGEYGGEAFIAMRFIDQGALADRDRMSLEEAARVSEQVARALHHAHQRGVLHRDVKPANVLIDGETGEPFLTDFGLAKLIEHDNHLTASIAELGTPAYMAPEQADRKLGSLTVATDIHGMGALFFELLTGQPPFEGESTLEVLRNVVEGPRPRPSSFRAGIDGDLETICLKCLERDPARRYATAGDLADDIARWRRGEPIEARPAGALRLLVKWARRRPAYASLVALATAAALVITIGSVLFSLRLDREKAEVTRQLIRVHESAAGHQEELGNPAKALLRLTEALRIAEASESEHVRHLRQRIAGLMAEIPSLRHMWFFDGSCETLCFSPDGRLLLTAGGGEARLRESGTGAPVGGAMRMPGRIAHASFNADGSRLTLASEVELDPGDRYRWLGAARVFDTVSTEALTPELPVLFRDQKRLLHPPVALSGGGSCIVTCNGGGALLRHIGEKEPLVLDCGGRGYCVAFTSDGDVVVVGSGDGAYLFDGRSGATLGVVATDSEVVGAQFSRNASELAVLTDEEVVLVKLSPEGRPLVGSERSFAAPEGSSMHQCIFSPDCGRLLTLDFRDQAILRDVETLEPAASPFVQPEVMMARFSSDGGMLVTCGLDGTARVWDLRTGEATTPPLHHGGSVFAADLHGYRLATASQDGVVRVWELPSPDRRSRSLDIANRTKGKRSLACEFSPDGAHLLTSLEGGGATLWRTDDWQRHLPVITFDQPHVRGRFSPDSAVFALAEATPEDPARSVLHLRRVADGTEVFAPVAIDGFANDAHFSRDGLQIAVSGFLADGSGFSQVVDARSGETRVAPIMHPAAVSCATLSPDGTRLATACDDRITRVFNALSGEPLFASPPISGSPRTVCWHPDGSHLLTACRGESYAPEAARLWNLHTGTGIELPHLDGVLAAKFDPHGERIATTGEDNSLRLWRFPSGEAESVPLMRGPSRPSSVAFSRDGSLVAIGTGHSRVLVYATESGERIAKFTSAGIIDGLAFSPPGADGRVRLAFASSFPATVHVVTVGADPRSVAEIEREVRLLSGYRFDPGVGLVPLGREALEVDWSRHPRPQR